MSRSPGLRARIAAAIAAFCDPKPLAAALPDRLEGYPPPYPRGWYHLVNSDALPPGAVVQRACLGQRFAIFRGERSGRVAVLDAHCPHQGANLAAGGIVCGDEIQCPFHHWRFALDGALSAIPRTDRLPRTGVRAWPVREHDGMVWVFFDDDAPPGAVPPYEPERHDDIASGALVHRGDLAFGEVAMHLVEFAENSVDFQHFEPVHSRMLLPWTRIAVPFVRVRHRPGWELDAERPWVATFTDVPDLTAFGRPLPRSSASAVVTLYGPGGIVYFRITLPDLGDILIYQTHLPTAPMVQRVHFRWFAHRRIPRALVSYVVGSWVSQWRSDIEIWENKIYRRKPVLSVLDGPVHRMRRWYQQFYERDAPAEALPASAGPS